jgi:hypothetical protein
VLKVNSLLFRFFFVFSDYIIFASFIDAWFLNSSSVPITSRFSVSYNFCSRVMICCLSERYGCSLGFLVYYDWD